MNEDAPDRKTLITARIGSKSEIVRRFVESEPDMDVGDNGSCVFVEAGAERNYARVLVEQGESSAMNAICCPQK